MDIVRLVIVVFVTLAYQLVLALMGEALNLKELLFLFLIIGLSVDSSMLRGNIKAIKTHLGIEKPKE